MPLLTVKSLTGLSFFCFVFYWKGYSANQESKTSILDTSLKSKSSENSKVVIVNNKQLLDLSNKRSNRFLFKTRNEYSSYNAASDDNTTITSLTENSDSNHSTGYSSSEDNDNITSISSQQAHSSESNNSNDVTLVKSKSRSKKNVTISYTYDAFFISDGRSRKRNLNGISNEPKERQRYTCTECGKHYATSSNLSRHKQTHRSPDSQLAKKCPTCNKVYVSMPALSMHVVCLTAKASQALCVCVTAV